MWKKFVSTWGRTKRLSKYHRPELFTDTNIFLHNWEQLNLTNDILWLLKDQGDRERTKELPSDEEFERAYFSLYDDYANLTELHEKMDRWRELMILRMEARVEVAEGNKARKNNIEIYTEQIKNIMKSEGDSDVIEHRMIIQQAYGQPINPKTTTLREFLTISRLMEKQAKPRTNGEDRE